MRALSLILVAVVALLGANIAAATPSQAPNQEGGSGRVPTAAPNQHEGSGDGPAPARSEPPAESPAAPAPSAARAPAAVAPPPPAVTPASAPPVRSTAKTPKSTRKQPARRTTEGLTATVARLRGCLPDLRRRNARVLVLRTGLGRSTRTSRAAIARALEISSARVRRAEERGLRELRAVARERECERDGHQAAGVVRGAMAALRAGQLERTASSSGDASRAREDRAPPSTGAVATGSGNAALYVAAGLAALLGLALIARGLRSDLQQ
jgi:hypothetical protein